MNDPPRSTCSACGSTETTSVCSALQVPAHVCSYWASAAEARACAKGDLTLDFCVACGFIENTSFDEKTAEYTGAYENSLHFSEFFQGYIADFAKQILEQHSTDGGVLEIGCGNGEFLELLCADGSGRGVGFDPAYAPGEPLTKLDGRLRFIRDYYSDQYVDIPTGLIVCRQVLEHISSPGDFLRSLRKTIGDRHDTSVIIEVPNTLYALENLSFWDIIYEHPNYFTGPTLARLFASCGFDVNRVWPTFADQFIAIDVKPAQGDVGHVPDDLQDLSSLPDLVNRFSRGFDETIEKWNDDLSHIKARGEKVVIWGTGARGVGFLNQGDRSGAIEYAVDINPRKHDKFVVGTGQQVVRPEFLKEYKPDHVILMNKIYREEITRDLDEMGLSPQILQA
ncbi:MAG: SAM-dependent methyltransferase [Planctomycetota bacterium]|jgi:SAM-dependent methyltransferase